MWHARACDETSKRRLRSAPAGAWAGARAVSRTRGALTVQRKVISALLLWVIAAGSKFVVLALVDAVFADAVSLGGFVSVTLLVVCLLLARGAVRRLLVSGPSATSTSADAPTPPPP